MKNKVAIITGAGSGIGQAAALGLIESGFLVVLSGRNKVTLEKTRSMTSYKDNALVVPCDVTQPEQVQVLFDKAVDHFGRVDVLFNNAGINVSGSLLEDLTLEEWKSVIDINLTGSFLCTREAFRVMKMQDPMGGRIINNGSLSAHVPRPNSAPYTSSKHAITGLTKSTALDGRKYNIACSQIDIGNAATEMAAKMETGVPQADGSMATEPLMDLQHVTDAIVYIAGLPLDANVLNINVMATKMPFVGRG